MTGMEGRRGAAEERSGFVGRSGRVIEGAGFGEGMVRRESREKRMRKGGGETSAMGLETKNKHCLLENKKTENVREAERVPR